jgi:hypothetical protein
MIPLLAISVLLLAILIYLFTQWNRHRMPSRKKRARLLAQMREEMDHWSPRLVKMNKEELDLFSLAQERQVVKTSGQAATARGTFTTIFHEPVVSYSYRRFLGKQVNALLYARTADHDYVYWTEKGKTRLEIDNQPVGNLNNNVLLGERTGKELARIHANGTENYLPVSVGNREVGALTQVRGEQDDPLSQRAFEFVPDDLSEKEEQLLMSLALRELVERGVG